MTSTQTLTDQTPGLIRAGSLSVRAGLAGGAAALAIAGVFWSVLPTELLDKGGPGYIWAGALIGLATGCIGNALIAFGAARPVEVPGDSAGFLRAVVLDFALQIFTVSGGMVGMFFKAVKFQHLAAFGIAFALVAMVCRITGTVLVSRALVARARARAAGAQASLVPESPVQDSHS